MELRITCVVVVVILTVAALPSGQAQLSLLTSPALAASAGDPAGPIAGLQQALGQIYDRVHPSVVNIRIVQKGQVAHPTLPEIPGSPFGPRSPFGRGMPQPPQEQYRRGIGSGFVWDKNGHIVSNNHVVAGADRITVTFNDGTTVQGKVVGADPDSDLAVVRVDVPEKYRQPVQIADSTKLKVGQLAVAIGNPFGLQSTMTAGIVSGVGRVLPVDAQDMAGPAFSIPDMIQTDAPINPGNSGGVLLDDQGRLIGVTTSILSPTGASIGIGFAIPSAIVDKVVPSLIKTGRYEHPWLGVSGTSLTPDLATAMKLKPDQRGALVIDVVPGSPADKAGLRGSDRKVTIEGLDMRVGGDVIVAVDGKPVQTFDDLLAYLVRSAKVGQNIDLTLLRDGKEQTVTVTLAPRPTSEAKATSPAGEAWLGISGITVTPDVAKLVNLSEKQGGVLVQQVEQGSPADKAGIRGSYKPVTANGRTLLIGGDIIVGVNGKTLKTLEELRSVVSRTKPGQKLTLDIIRDGKKMQLTVVPQQRPSAGMGRKEESR